MTKIVAIDLFCGVGGLTHGFIKAGINVSAGIDMDQSCKYAYEKNNPSKFIEKDINKITSPELKLLYPKDSIKVLSGIYFDSVKYLSPLIEAVSYDDTMVEAVLYPFTKQLSDNNSNARWQAAMILGEIGDKRAIRYLVEALQDDDEKVRTNVTQALQKLGHEVEE